MVLNCTVPRLYLARRGQYRAQTKKFLFSFGRRSGRGFPHKGQ